MAVFISSHALLFPAQAGVIPKTKTKTKTKTLFPAQAGVIPIVANPWYVDVAVPRASGGDPIRKCLLRFDEHCSPRKRG